MPLTKQKGVAKITSVTRMGTRRDFDAKLARQRSEFVSELRVFDGHVFEFAGLEYLATFKALDIFRVFVARHDAHTGVLALCHVGSLLGN